MHYRANHDPSFEGDPVLELHDELIDAMNYASEAENRGLPMAAVTRRLEEAIAEVRQAWADLPVSRG
jgi:hypothetical protein